MWGIAKVVLMHNLGTLGSAWSHPAVNNKYIGNAAADTSLFDIMQGIVLVTSEYQGLNSPCKAIMNLLRPIGDICVGELSHHCFRKWLVGWFAASHCLNQCRGVVHWTQRNILQWNFNRNAYIFIVENAFENSVLNMAAILSRPQCVNKTRPQQKKAPFWGRHFQKNKNARIVNDLIVIFPQNLSNSK